MAKRTTTRPHPGSYVWLRLAFHRALHPDKLDGGGMHSLVLVRRLVVLSVLFVPWVAVASSAESLDERFLAGLRERRLFSLAENYCLRRIAEPDLPNRARTELAIELIRTYAEHAVQSPPAQRPPLWKQAHQVTADFKEAFSDTPRWMLVEFQDALVWLAEGELARQEAEVGQDSATRQEAARRHLRRAIDGLEQLREDAELALRRAPRTGGDGQELSAVELAALEKNIAYQFARALRNQGQTYPPQSADRANSLTRAVELLTPLAELTVADQLVWRSRIDRAICQRLLNRIPQAARELDALLAADPPAEFAIRARAEKLRLLLAQGDLAAAVGALDDQRPTLHGDSADLDFARLEVMVAAARAAEQNDEQQSRRWQELAAAKVRRIERDHGPYWMRRAETLLARSVAGRAGGDLSAMARAAESYYRSGQIDEALHGYDRAFAEAMDKGDGEQAFELGFTAATIEHERDHFEQAAQRYASLATALRRHPRSGEAHLLAALDAARAAQTTDLAGRSTWLTRYAALLEEHLALWPDGESANTARLWQGKLLASDRRWAEAIEAYRGIPENHSQFEAALQETARCYDRWLGELPDGPEQKSVSQQAITYFDGILLGPSRQWPQDWTALDRFCATTSARLRLAGREPDARSAEQLLSAALDGSPDAPESWQSEARTLLVHALVAQNKYGASLNVLNQVSQGSPQQLVALLSALVEYNDKTTGEARRQLAELELHLVELLNARLEALHPQDRNTYRTARAAALSAAGKHREAIEAYRRLADEFPEAGDFHEALAAALVAGGDVESGLAKWRQVEKKSRPGAARWMRARYAQAEAYLNLGQAEKSAKLIKITEVLHPNLGGPSMKQSFQTLLKRASP